MRIKCDQVSAVVAGGHREVCLGRGRLQIVERDGGRFCLRVRETLVNIKINPLVTVIRGVIAGKVSVTRSTDRVGRARHVHVEERNLGLAQRSVEVRHRIHLALHGPGNGKLVVARDDGGSEVDGREVNRGRLLELKVRSVTLRAVHRERLAVDVCGQDVAVWVIGIHHEDDVVPVPVVEAKVAVLGQRRLRVANLRTIVHGFHLQRTSCCDTNCVIRRRLSGVCGFNCANLGNLIRSDDVRRSESGDDLPILGDGTD